MKIKGRKEEVDTFFYKLDCGDLFKFNQSDSDEEIYMRIDGDRGNENRENCVCLHNGHTDFCDIYLSVTRVFATLVVEE